MSNQSTAPEVHEALQKDKENELLGKVVLFRGYAPNRRAGIWPAVIIGMVDEEKARLKVMSSPGYSFEAEAPYRKPSDDVVNSWSWTRDGEG